jgi:uncharacterized protein with PIN domain
MKRTRDQKKAELLAHAEVVIEELLDWDEETERPNLRQIEEVVLRLRQRLGERLAEVVAEGQEAVQPAETPRCPSCGEAMRYKGRKGLDVESLVGALDLERGHYHCARCRSGIFPPGQTTGAMGQEVE